MLKDTKQPEYHNLIPLWEICRDTYSGQNAIKGKREQYLPRLTNSSLDAYENYLKRAVFFNAMRQTIHGLLGLMFRRLPKIELPSEFQYLINPQDDQQHLTLFIINMATEVLITGRYGILIETDDEGQIKLVGYPAESIFQWSYGRILLYEEEVTYDDSSDKFDKIQYLRALTLNNDGIYIQQIYEKKETDADYALVNEITPMIRGNVLNKIPFFVVPDQTQHPFLLDLANMNISHYLASADLEYGRHWTALPTIYVTGLTNPDDPRYNNLPVGGEYLWKFEEGVNVGLLEFMGGGLGSLEKGSKEKEEKMAALGAQNLEVRSRASETAEALRIRQSGEISVLVLISRKLSFRMTQILNLAANWAQIKGDNNIAVSLNEDFFDHKMSPEELKQLVASWQAGILPPEVVAHNLVTGEMIPSTMSIEELTSYITTSSEVVV